MTWLFENPVYLLILGGVTVAILGVGAVQMRQRGLFVACFVAVLVTGGLLLLERFVETDAERVAATLHEIAREVARNDITAAVEHVHSSAPAVRRRALAELPQYEFLEVNIKSNLEVTVDRQQSPRKAVAQFNVVVVGSDRDRLIGQRRVPRFCIVTFLEEDGQWRIVDYQHREPTFGLFEKD